MLRSLAPQHQYKGFPSVNIYVGRSVSEPANMRPALCGHFTG
jgi:hypothetical protein